VEHIQDEHYLHDDHVGIMSNLSDRKINRVQFVPFVLAQLWTDLGRVEQTMVEQIIREYLRTREVNDGG
jgi:hypothetical protein